LAAPGLATSGPAALEPAASRRVASRPTVSGLVSSCPAASRPAPSLPPDAEEALLAVLRRAAPESERDAGVPPLHVGGQCVLITGAGGTIGGELARQVAALGPRELLLLERSETALLRLELELGRDFPNVDVVPVLGDVLDVRALVELFGAHRPSVVLHAAAYKHVPVAERQPIAAVRNNVFGTRAVAAAAAAHGAESFLLVSTDKAVNPAGVMGVTKRVAELVVLA